MKPEIPAYSIESLVAADGHHKEVDLFRFQYFARHLDRLRDPHRHHFYTFILVTGGSGQHDIDFRQYELKAGRLFLIAPGQVHAWQAFHQLKGYVLFFTDSFMALSKGRRLLSSWPLFRNHQSCFFDLDKTVLNYWVTEFDVIEQELQHPDRFSNDAIFYAISTLLVSASRLMVRQHPLSPKPDLDLLFRFQELIEQHFAELKTPQDYAMLLAITPNHLNALCKRKSGMTAGQLIRQRIILEAKRLLAHTKLSVSEIAFRLGFSDNSYFGRFFKKYNNITPEGFRLASRPVSQKIGRHSQP